MKTYYGTGRRKTSTARVFLKAGTGKVSINGKTAEEFLPYVSKRKQALNPLYLVKQNTSLDLYVTVKGGGMTGQSGAIQHGLARALIDFSPENRSILKKHGYLTRDSRMVERKKPGRHKARKSTQFTKR